MNRTANVVWQGTGQDGQGRITTQSGAIKDQPYSASARFQSEDGQAGTNPEELLGAAHASCFTMALAFRLSAAGHPATELRTQSRVELVKTDAGWTIPRVHLAVVGTVPGIDAPTFMKIAGDAKANCPLSKALKVDIGLDARLG